MAQTMSSVMSVRAFNTARVAAPKGRSVMRVFATASTSQSAGKEYMGSLPGISAPLGEKGVNYWDPLGFTENPAFSVAEAQRFRESELTHGRVAMLAALGWLVQEEFHPLFGGNISGPAFVHFQKVESVVPQFWELILLAIGIAESYRISVGWNDPRVAGQQLKADYTPGDLGFDPLGLYPSDPAEQYELKTKELNNGRLAMIAIAGFAAQEEVDHITIWKGLVKEGVVPAAEANLLQ